MATPRLSIGLPVFNGERYVGESIESLLGQSFGDFELIVCDNASEDGTQDIVEAYVRRDARVRYVRNDVNLGASGNFNKTLDLASADYFKWACADDRLADGFLAAAMAELDANPEAVLCYGGITIIDANGRATSTHDEGRNFREADPVERFRRASTRFGLLNVLQGVMRRQAVHESGKFGNFRGSDEVLVVELSLRGKFHEVSCPMLFRRMHAQAASAGDTIESRQEHLDPSTRGKISTWYWRHAIEHLKAIWRAPLPTGTRMRLTKTVLSRMVEQRNHLRHEAQAVASQVARRYIPR
jgi:glycosyltransferase involved in cell wall biosynthesis